MDRCGGQRNSSACIAGGLQAFIDPSAPKFGDSWPPLRRRRAFIQQMPPSHVECVPLPIVESPLDGALS
eukprot:scaffold121408_cov30-Tisochrysis_lutea.AAC.11